MGNPQAKMASPACVCLPVVMLIVRTVSERKSGSDVFFRGRRHMVIERGIKAIEPKRLRAEVVHGFGRGSKVFCYSTPLPESYSALV